MSQSSTYLLLAGVMVLPLLGALLLRALEHYIGRAGVYAGALVTFVAAAGCTLALARNPAEELRVGQLTVIQPLSFDMPAEAGEDHNHADQPSEALEGPQLATPTRPAAEVSSPTVRPLATPRPITAPTAQPVVTATATATATASPTAEPSATSEPTDEPTDEPTEAPPEDPAPGPRVYVVQPGDTIRTIATQFDVSVEAIMAANDMTEEEADQIVPDQELIIP